MFYSWGDWRWERDLPLAKWQVNLGKAENGTSQALSIPSIPGPICCRYRVRCTQVLKNDGDQLGDLVRQHTYLKGW